MKTLLNFASGNTEVGRFVALLCKSLHEKLHCGEESPDRTGQSAVESTDGGNLMQTVTENYHRSNAARVKTRGKSSRAFMAT